MRAILTSIALIGMNGFALASDHQPVGLECDGLERGTYVIPGTTTYPDNFYEPIREEKMTVEVAACGSAFPPELNIYTIKAYIEYNQGQWCSNQPKEDPAGRTYRYDGNLFLCEQSRGDASAFIFEKAGDTWVTHRWNGTAMVPTGALQVAGGAVSAFSFSWSYWGTYPTNYGGVWAAYDFQFASAQGPVAQDREVTLSDLPSLSGIQTTPASPLSFAPEENKAVRFINNSSFFVKISGPRIATTTLSPRSGDRIDSALVNAAAPTMLFLDIPGFERQNFELKVN